MQHQQAHTMVEIIIVVAILGLAIGTIFSIAEVSSKIWSEGKVASELREDTRTALYLFTREFRESSLATIFLGPGIGPPYNAISFGRAERDAASGLIILDSENNIIWENTIIYHTYNNPGGGTELRKSVLNWDSGLTDAQRQAQVDSYVDSSDGREIIKNIQSGGAGLLDFSAEEYDYWTETDFFDDGIDTDKVVVSGGNVFLDGGGQTWFVGGQTGDDIPDDINNSSAAASSYRILIRSGSLFKSGSRVKVKLVASSSGTAGDSVLNITSPSLAETDGTNSQDIVDITNSALTFDSGTFTYKTLITDGTVWTDWFSWEAAVGEVFNKDKNYSITYYTDPTQTTSGTNFNPRQWDGTVTQEFVQSGDASGTADWGTSGTPEDYIYAIEEIEVSYCSSGTLTSQIYNTGVNNPIYDTVKWTETLPTGTDISIKVRSSDNADMSGAAAWSTLTAFTDGSIDNDISGIGTGRYVQFQAVLTSPSPYEETPILSDVVLTWKGGIIKITVDRYYNYRGRGYSISMTSDVKPKNR